nr:glutaredoxin-C9-like [Ipomoea batatas]
MVGPTPRRRGAASPRGTCNSPLRVKIHHRIAARPRNGDEGKGGKSGDLKGEKERVDWIAIVSPEEGDSGVSLETERGGEGETKMLAKESIRMGRRVDERAVKSTERVRSLASGNAVVTSSPLSGCCMWPRGEAGSSSASGSAPPLLELDRDAHGREIYDLLLKPAPDRLPGSKPQPVPAVFWAGRFFGRH